MQAIDLDRYDNGKPASFAQCKRMLDELEAARMRRDVTAEVWYVGTWVADRAIEIERNLTETQAACTRQELDNRELRRAAAVIETSMRAILAAREGEAAWVAACRVMVDLAEARVELGSLRFHAEEGPGK